MHEGVLVAIPASMRASVLHPDLTIHLEERPVPEPAAGDVLIQVASVGVCGSDIHYYRRGRIGDQVVRAPMVLGHEAGGRIVAVGDGVDESRVGERVAIEPQRPCRVCSYCRSGAYNLCPRIAFYATPPIDGAFAEYVTIPADFAYAVPDSVSDHSAALIEPLSVGIAAAQKGRVGLGDVVFITGGGPIGLIAGQVARAFGAAEVVVSEPDASRRAHVAGYGFAAVDPADGALAGLGAHTFIDASGSTQAIESGLLGLRRGGTAVLVGAAGVVPLSVPLLSSREINVTSIFRYTNTWPIGITLLTSGAVELDDLVTHEYGLSQVEESLQNVPHSLKRIVLPGIDTVDVPALTDRARESAS